MTRAHRVDPLAPRVTLIVARAANGVIGYHNTLPWRLPEDLQHFKATTLGHVLVMGRRTFESIGRPLPGRRTIVLTRDPNWSRPGCERAGSIGEAIALAGHVPEVFIAGGGEVYRDALTCDLVDRAIVTEIELEPEGDAFFPGLDPTIWLPIDKTVYRSAAGVAYTIATYRNQSRDTGSATISTTPP